MARDFSKQFYNSKTWERTREYILMRDRYTCTHCGRPAQEVHHIKHLTEENINDPNVALNPSNLTSLCRDCHFEEHRQDQANGRRKHGGQSSNKEIGEGYTFDENGQLVKISNDFLEGAAGQ